MLPRIQMASVMEDGLIALCVILLTLLASHFTKKALVVLLWQLYDFLIRR